MEGFVTRAEFEQLEKIAMRAATQAATATAFAMIALTRSTDRAGIISDLEKSMGLGEGAFNHVEQHLDDDLDLFRIYHNAALQAVQQGLQQKLSTVH